MHAKLLTFLLISSLLAAACEKKTEPPPSDWFEFGFLDCSLPCITCSNMYKLEDGHLYRADETTCSIDSVEFTGRPLSSSKLAIAENLLDSMPAGFQYLQESYFDQYNFLGSVYYVIRVSRDGHLKTWKFSASQDIGWTWQVGYWRQVADAVELLK